MSGNDMEHKCYECGDTWIAHAIDDECFNCSQNKAFDEIDEFIENNEILCSISCQPETLRRELIASKRYDLIEYLPEKNKPDYTNYLCADKYNFDYYKRLCFQLESPVICNSVWLWNHSNDFRSYERWIKALDNQMKQYANIAPLQIIEHSDPAFEKVYAFCPELFHALTMPMSGKLYSHLRVYRSKLLHNLSKKEGKCIFSEFLNSLEEEEKLKADAEAEWNDI